MPPVPKAALTLCMALRDTVRRRAAML